ncbi:iron-containing alcohol dehydrogenase [Sulfitobacter sp. THAF37]|uniref:iron-containing alcohol dehydrogenase n=1 Tax=Sulfitobacter sp. THAF37 TaxID=2587855 RepID=UPI0020C7B6BE|nr:iron-containing alcohol dehydrogenase [Sulfitobacter sp. THAF37]
MTSAARHFAISCPTAVHFGTGRSADLPDLLGPGSARILFVQGGSGRAAAPVLATLRRAGYDITVISCGGEPGIGDVNAALAGLDPPTHVIACGGGAVLDMGKALAALAEHGLTLPEDFADLPPLPARRDISLIALPTTAGTGAEVTANAVIDVPAKGAKISLRGAALIPDIAVVDPALAQSAPASVTLASGLDAVTQVIESYTSNAATPFTTALCGPAIPLGLRALRGVVDAADDPTAWEDMCWTSLSSGLALANSGLGAAHGLASVLGARLGAPHGALCGRLLVPTLRTNLAHADAVPEVRDRIRYCIAAIDAAFPPAAGMGPLSGFEQWMNDRGLPRLSAHGLALGHIEDLAAQGSAASSSRKNAVPLPAEGYVAILSDAF